MEERAVHQQTLDFIRHITSDGIVEKDEVWDLGRFLADTNEARVSWPGSAIWDILEDIFADNVVTDEEAESLTQQLRDFEKEIHARNNEGQPAPAASDESYKVHDLVLPKVDLCLDIESHLPNEPDSKVNLGEHSCSCRDWVEHRKDFGANSIGRMCRCMATGFERAMNGRPELYDEISPGLVNLIRLLSTYGLGGVSEADWRQLDSDGFQHFVSWDNGDWISVFTENDEGQFERFGFNRKENRWSFVVQPVGAGAVLNFVKEHLRDTDGQTAFV